MAKKQAKSDIGHPDYMPPQRIAGNTPEECDAEVAGRIKNALIGIMNAMGHVPEIAEGEVVPDVDLMEMHYEQLGLMLKKMRQRLERLEPPPKASQKKRSGKRSQSVISVSATDGFD